MFEFLKNEKISYSVYSENFELKEDNIKVVYDILKKNFYKKYPKKVNFREYTEFKYNLLSFVNKKNNYIFTINRNNKIVGFSIGVLKNKTFFESHIYIHPKHQGKKLGSKLSLRVLGYTRSNLGIKKFIPLNVENNAIFDINKHIAERKNKSKSVKYSLKKDKNHNIFNKNANYIYVK